MASAGLEGDKAAKRREIRRRYYKAHPEVREKNRLRIAERRLAKKQYRRQWDKPKKQDSKATDNFAPQAEQAAEETARAALTALYRRSKMESQPHDSQPADREPKGLTEIDEVNTSDSESDTQSRADVAPEPQAESQPKCLAEIEEYQSSQETTISQVVRRLRKRWRDRQAAKKAQVTIEDARLEAEKAARMRIVVESRYVSPSP
ncbi:hypothetical protein B0H11DRAFT_2243721 [Mycena galericulata]|nr:hypothetical protein B0H11DRAFT_2243721 [Mycena galericulata]